MIVTFATSLGPSREPTLAITEPERMKNVLPCWNSHRLDEDIVHSFVHEFNHIADHFSSFQLPAGVSSLQSCLPHIDDVGRAADRFLSWLRLEAYVACCPEDGYSE